MGIDWNRRCAGIRAKQIKDRIFFQISSGGGGRERERFRVIFLELSLSRNSRSFPARPSFNDLFLLKPRPPLVYYGTCRLFRSDLIFFFLHAPLFPLCHSLLPPPQTHIPGENCKSILSGTLKDFKFRFKDKL